MFGRRACSTASGLRSGWYEVRSRQIAPDLRDLRDLRDRQAVDPV